MPYRVAAPPLPEPPELEEPYVAVLRAQRRRARIATAAAIVFVAAGIAKVARSGQTSARRATTEAVRADGAREAIARARTRAALAQSRFEQGIRDAIAGEIGPRADLGRCPIDLPSRGSVLGQRDRPSFPLLILDRTELDATLPSQAVAEVLADIRRARDHLASGRYEEAKLYARALDRPERFKYDVVLVSRTTKGPRALSGNAYEPGALEGRAFIYDFATASVLCAGDVKITSSMKVGYVFSDRADAPASLGARASMTDALRDDLRVQSEQAIALAVRWRSGPPAP